MRALWIVLSNMVVDGAKLTVLSLAVSSVIWFNTDFVMSINIGYVNIFIATLVILEILGVVVKLVFIFLIFKLASLYKTSVLDVIEATYIYGLYNHHGYKDWTHDEFAHWLSMSRRWKSR